MKLESVSVIFVLGLTGLAGKADGLCLVRNGTTPDQYYYQCFRSNDYLADLKRAPVDIFGHVVSNSKIEVIRNGSYARVSKSLENLAVLYCGVKEIEDNAFRGLTKLRMLNLMGNKLKIIKSAWFRGLSNLKMASFKSNQITYVEDNFFSILPPMNVLDIANNQLTCLPTASFGNFKTNKFLFSHNRLTWMCQVLILDWLKDAGFEHDYFELGNMDPPHELAKLCVKKLPKSRLNGEFLNKCTEEMTRELLPKNKNYTVAQVCEFLKGKPSPFLDCTK